jgi:hypothetical protein
VGLEVIEVAVVIFWENIEADNVRLVKTMEAVAEWQESVLK